MTMVLHIQAEKGPTDFCAGQIVRLCGLDHVAVADAQEACTRGSDASRMGRPILLLYHDTALAAHLAGAGPEVCSRFEQLRRSSDSLAYGRSDAVPLPPAAERSLRFSAAPLAGCAIKVTDARASAFPDGEGLGSVLAAVDGRAILTRHDRNGRLAFALAWDPDVDLASRAVPSLPSSRYYGGIMPLAFALRDWAGEACWHNPFPGACVIIDDPLLRPRYGFFSYGDVLNELDRGDYALTVAFIPCNHSRSDAAVVRAVAAHRRRFSICVHGCYHSEGEFADPDPAVTRSRAAAGLRMMRAHEAGTGLPFDHSMVFPQGAFTSGAMAALEAAGYLAAVNSTIHPRDSGPPAVQIGDLFALAQLRFSDLPLFSRRYPGDVADFVVDRFWGKPVLVVEHHDYFRNGARRMTEFVAGLQAALPELEWLTLDQVLIQSALYRRRAPAEYEVWFVTARFRLRNPGTGRSRFHCWKQESHATEIRAVRVGGAAAPFRMADRRLELEVELEPGAETLIQIEYDRPPLPILATSRSLRARVFLRRRLSEFRDNYLSRNRRIVALVRRAKNALFRWF